MNTAVDFMSKPAYCYYTVYAKSADTENRYFPWDNLQFKTKEHAEKHRKAEEIQNPDWWNRLTVVRVDLEIEY
jgi:hypothetical protein